MSESFRIKKTCAHEKRNFSQSPPAKAPINLARVFSDGLMHFFLQDQGLTQVIGVEKFGSSVILFLSRKRDQLPLTWCQSSDNSKLWICRIKTTVELGQGPAKCWPNEANSFKWRTRQHSILNESFSSFWPFFCVAYAQKKLNTCEPIMLAFRLSKNKYI